jgi:hypothetical protein
MSVIYEWYHQENNGTVLVSQTQIVSIFLKKSLPILVKCYSFIEAMGKNIKALIRVPNFKVTDYFNVIFISGRGTR